ncbi:hypothetical protein D3C79_595110 [compost metagenome]
MPVQITGMRRYTVVSQIIRRSTGQHLIAPQWTRDQTTAVANTQVTDAHYCFKTLLYDVHRTVGQAEVYLNVRVSLHELPNKRHQAMLTKLVGCANA